MTVDTNILIAYLGGEVDVINAIVAWRREGRPLFISTITECEVLSYPRLSVHEEEKVKAFLRENFILIPFDSARAQRAAAIRRSLPTLKLPDAAIAALARETETFLVTRNVRDFKKIAGIEVVTV